GSNCNISERFIDQFMSNSKGHLHIVQGGAPQVSTLFRKDRVRVSECSGGARGCRD
ncbi:hypothetical protein K443DRAFT_354480, partial [Laccaria amethystina LaAM-08-1]